MIVYHEVAPADVPGILRDGIKQGQTGEKSDELIRRTDELLDEFMPDELRRHGVSRQRNIYGYLVEGHSVIDITDGRWIPVETFVRNSKQAVLRLRVVTEHCFISDLDAFDAVKESIETGKSEEDLQDLVAKYWHCFRSVKESLREDIKRPEVMIISDVQPSDIKRETAP